MRIKLFIVVVVLGVLYYAFRPCSCHGKPNHGCKKPCTVEEEENNVKISKASLIPSMLFLAEDPPNEDDDRCEPVQECGWQWNWAFGFVYVCEEITPPGC